MASVGIAPPDVKDVTLSLFGSRKTDIAPSDLPEGLTADEQDGIYLPGQWQSRPGLGRLYAAGTFVDGTSVLYEKTYVQPNDDALTLILTSDGALWVEDVGLSLAPVQKSKVAAGLYAQSITEFGREYMAFSDLLHGQGIPLQYDGSNLDRVTMDGPAAPPTVADITFPEAITNVSFPATGLASYAIATATETGNTVTLTTTGATGYLPGQSVIISGVSVAGYNGLQVIVAVTSATSFTYTLTAGGLGAGAGGTVTLAVIGVQGVAITANAHVGDSISIFGNAGNFNNGIGTNPPFWTVVKVQGPNLLYASISTSTATTFTGGINGTLTIGGVSSGGVHQCVVMFLTRQGYLTRPSPATPLVSAGNTQWRVTNLPIGPPNTVARVLGFTGAGGDNFFIIPATVNLPSPLSGTNPFGVPITVQSTIVPDNTSSTFTFDIPDNTLFAATPIDQIGNDLFDQVVLGPVLGFFAFASRLACWGDYTKIENFLSNGFEGGALVGSPTVPLGWTVVTAGGVLVTGGSWAAGQFWRVHTDGTGNPNGQISQPAYQDSFGDAILSPSTKYIFRAWVRIDQLLLPGAANVVAEFYSASGGGSLATATIPITSTEALFGGLIAQANFSAATPAQIPADTVLRLSANSTGFFTAPFIDIDDWEIDFAVNPYRDTLSRWSYINNPEAFAQTTGNLGPTDDASPIRCFALLRQSSLLETGEGVHSFSDNDFEPDQWNVGQLTRAVGGLSLRAGDPGKFGTGDAAEDWALVAGKNGVYLFAGAEFWKVSQEISRGPLPQAQDPRKCWDDINWAAQQTIVAKNDPAKRRAYFAVPINGALTPNVVFVLDYREMDTATQIAGAAPLHITLQGKMRSSDLTRKWSVWNVAANDIEILVRPNNDRQLCFAGGLNPQGNAFANLYALDPTKLTDDDYGAIAPYYTTYFFTDHETEQALGIGSDMHLVKHIHSFVTGVGLVIITPTVNSLYNFMPSLSPRVLVADTDQSNFLKSDLEWSNVGLRGQRIAFRISVQPLPGATDVQLRLQKFVVGMMRDPVAPFRQSGV